MSTVFGLCALLVAFGARFVEQKLGYPFSRSRCAETKTIDNRSLTVKIDMSHYAKKQPRRRHRV